MLTFQPQCCSLLHCDSTIAKTSAFNKDFLGSLELMKFRTNPTSQKRESLYALLLPTYVSEGRLTFHRVWGCGDTGSNDSRSCPPSHPLEGNTAEQAQNAEIALLMKLSASYFFFGGGGGGQLDNKNLKLSTQDFPITCTSH